MTIPCNRPYDRLPLDSRYVAAELGLDEYRLNTALHLLKKYAGIGGADRVTICLDDGEVYVSRSHEHIGSLFNP